MYYKDMSYYVNYSNHPILNIKSVGWLAQEKVFKVGKVPEDFLGKLARIIKGSDIFESVCTSFRGITECSLNGLSYECEGTRNKDGYLMTKENSYLLGTGDILIPSVDYQYFFFAPTLIYHYVEIHNYLPPEEFIEAVLNFDFTRPFNALEIYENIGY